MQIIKYFNFLLIVMLISIATNAQTLTSSPYSRYGIGDIANKGFGRNKAIGNTGIALRSPYHLNPVNPASYSALDSLSFIYEFGILGKQTKFKTSNMNYSQNNININFIAIGFPVTKFWFCSVGLLPYSHVGYSIKTDSVYQSIDSLRIQNYYNGSGGINQFYFGNSIKLSKKLSLGVSMSYLFGSLTQANSTVFPNDVNSFELITQKHIKVNDFYFNYGLQYSDSIKHNYSYTVGLIFDNQSKISASKSEIATNFIYSNTSKREYLIPVKYRNRRITDQK
jgi:hypothetical protein